uniref:Uncharacterized protein n=1 Tax=Opuntia streptacantha TaxID=393608 RepID=A0A7C9DAR0_OPUST
MTFLQLLLPLAVVPATQAGRCRTVSCGSPLQMAFKPSYHLQPCRLPRPDAIEPSVGGHDYKCPSIPPTTCSRAGCPSGYPNQMTEECQLGGHEYKWPSNSSNHL